MNPDNDWQPTVEDKIPWVEIDQKENIAIGAFSIIENTKDQKIALQYKKGEKWENAIVFKTNGTGQIIALNVPITARYFRLEILEAKEPKLNEWILFRAD